MTREEKIRYLQDVKAGNLQSPVLKRMMEAREVAKATAAISQCDFPMLQYIAHRIGDPDKKVEIISEFAFGVLNCQTDEELSQFVTAFGEKRRDEITDYVRRMHEWHHMKTNARL